MHTAAKRGDESYTQKRDTGRGGEREQQRRVAATAAVAPHLDRQEVGAALVGDGLSQLKLMLKLMLKMKLKLRTAAPHRTREVKTESVRGLKSDAAMASAAPQRE
jgi:CHAD domain-containing protein